MNKIEALRAEIGHKFPDAVLQLTAPLLETGIWILDIDRGAIHLDVEWSEAAGFGITSTHSSVYGSGSDELISEPAEAFTRVSYLITTGEATMPPIGAMVSRLRDTQGITQKELAERIGISQATVSGIERRADIQTSTLQRIAKALGGDLEIFISIRGKRHRVSGATLCDEGASGIIDTRQAVTRDEVGGHRSHRKPHFEALAKTGKLQSSMALATRVYQAAQVLQVPV